MQYTLLIKMFTTLLIRKVLRLQLLESINVRADIAGETVTKQVVQIHSTSTLQIN